ncbi:MAG: hypothetical protein ABSF82_06935 [Candidatus Bathyarchaeia archaeon]
MKAVLTEHNFACFTCAPVTDGPIDQIFATFSAVTLWAWFVRHEVFTRHRYGPSYLTHCHVHDMEAICNIYELAFFEWTWGRKDDSDPGNAELNSPTFAGVP